MKYIQIFLLVLIIIGIGLLCTQNMWVPKVVNYMLKGQTYTVTPPQKQIPLVKTVVRQGKVDMGVEGIATFGPTCGNVRIDPDTGYPDTQSCADKPYQTTFVIHSDDTKVADIVVKTDTQGYFSQKLPAGTYTIHLQQQGKIVPRFTPQTFEVLSDRLTSLNLFVDSGIR